MKLKVYFPFLALFILLSSVVENVSGQCVTSAPLTVTNSTPVATVDNSTVTSTIVVAGAPTYLTDLNIITNLTHTWAADLDITITSPSGTVVTLTTDNGGSNVDVFDGTIWDDNSGSGPIFDYIFSDGVLASPLAPEEPLGIFIGENPNGIWTISVGDDANGDDGTLSSWSLVIKGFTTTPTVTSVTYNNNTPLSTVDNTTVTSTIVVSGAGTQLVDVNVLTNLIHTWAADLDITITSPAGTVVTLTTDNGGSNVDVFNGTIWDDNSGTGPIFDYIFSDGVLASPLTPEDALAKFMGENPNGTWTISVGDDANGDDGTLNSWALTIVTATCVIGPGPCTITCPANITVGNSAGQCGAIVNYPAPVTTGGCGVVTTTPASGTLFPIGTTTVTATVAGGGPTCTFTVTVNDTEAPSITCPANINIATLAGQCTRVVTYTLPAATDNCPGALTVTGAPASGSAFALGNTTVTITARDAANNVRTCSFVVTVTDGQLPVITTQPVNRSACATTATNTIFSVVATNAVSYQWQVNAGSGFTNISGATGSSLTLSNIPLSWNGYQYRVLVNGLCTQIISNAATLTVNRLPVVFDISASPRNKLSPGQTTSLSVTYDGFPGTFTWFRNNVLSRVTPTPTITNLTVDSTGIYRVMLTDVNGCTATSADFQLLAEPDFRFFVFPNPNNGVFQVRFYSYTLGVKRTLSVFDSRGTLVFKREFIMTSPYEKMDVDVSRYTRGYYHVELRDESGKYLGSGSALFLQ